MRTVYILGVLLFATVFAQAEEITGHACYRYSDSESLIVARDTASSLAKREALESYAVFVESASALENAQIRNDLITSLSGGLMRGLRVTEQQEDLQKREVCVTLRADVEPIEVKNVVISRLNAFRRQRENLPTGLPENASIKTLKVEQPSQYYCKSCLQFTFWCKKAIPSTQGLYRATWYDRDGVPDKTLTNSNSSPLSGRLFGDHGGKCERKGDVLKTDIEIPDPATGYTYSIELLE